MACSALNMYWKCSVVLCQTVLPAVASTGSPTGSPRSLPKRAKSPHPENGQRLAGNADHPSGTAATRRWFGRYQATGLETPLMLLGLRKTAGSVLPTAPAPCSPLPGQDTGILRSRTERRAAVRHLSFPVFREHVPLILARNVALM